MIEVFKQVLGCPLEQVELFSDEPMSRHTSFRIGGPADLLVSPKSEQAVCSVVRAAKRAGLPLTVLGNGSNILVSDAGIRGVVLCIGSGYADVQIEDSCITAESGVSLSVLSNEAQKAGLTGLEFAGGIPGSLGGALFMNAGAYDGQMADVVVSTRYYDAETDAIQTITGDAHAFGYRTSIFKQHPSWVIISSRMELKKGSSTAIRAKMDDFNQRRRDKQPLNYPSAGSTFKRPAGYFAGKLIQDAGLKGYAIGGAQVSEKHAGFVINRGGATCEDVLALISHIQQEVKNQFGVQLETEIRML